MKKSILVAFWSPFHGQTGQTTGMAAVGAYIGINYNISTLLMHSQFTRSNLENAFLAHEKNLGTMLFDEKGINAVEKLARTKQLSDKSFTDYTTTLIPGRLEILMGAFRSGNEAQEQMAEAMPYILACARQAFDLVLCDVNSGGNSELTGIILKNADLVVVCLNQNLEVLRGYFDGKLLHSSIQDSKRLLLLGNFDTNSQYSIRSIRRLFHYKEKLCTLPRCTSLIDAHNGHNLLRLIYSGSQIKKKDEDYGLMESLADIAPCILQNQQEDVNLLHKPLKKQSLSDILKIFTKKG